MSDPIPQELQEDQLCNLCGYSCQLKDPDANYHDNVGGLIGTIVGGGFDSTPGNGYGAFDDMTSYRFSLCEFCLDWLFAQFKIPVDVWDIMDPANPEVWEPAAVRLTKRDFGSLKHKEFFFQEFAKRRANSTKDK